MKNVAELPSSSYESDIPQDAVRLEANTLHSIETPLPDKDNWRSVATLHIGGPETNNEATGHDDFAIIDLRNTVRDEQGGRLFDGMYYPSDVEYLIVQPDVYEADKTRGYKALRRGESFMLGRSNDGATRRFDLSDKVSRNHVELNLSKDGELGVMDLRSTNGSYVVEHTQPRREKTGRTVGRQVLRMTMENHNDAERGYETFAKHVEPYELVRTPDNGGKPIDKEYQRNHEMVRKLFVDALASGNLYASQDTFESYVKHAHGLAAAGDVYNRVGAAKDGLEADDIGVYRHDGSPINMRWREADMVAQVARRYGDLYGSQPRYEASLPGIDENYQVHDVKQNGGYVFSYPDSKAIPQYMAQMTRLGAEIGKQFAATQPDVARVIDLVARQYQYGAIVRPFKQINNSLFMDLVNTQLKMFGLPGMSHGSMDHVAQRLQPENFVRYFKDVYAQQAATHSAA